MSSEPRSRLSPDERRTQVVAIGVGFLAEHPLAELTIDELASRAGISKALIFHYFDSRQGVERAIVTMARDSLLAATKPRAEPPLRGFASGDPAVRAIVE